jgi:hypothetical protein
VKSLGTRKMNSDNYYYNKIKLDGRAVLGEIHCP